MTLTSNSRKISDLHHPSKRLTADIKMKALKDKKHKATLEMSQIERDMFKDLELFQDVDEDLALIGYNKKKTVGSKKKSVSH